MITDSQIRSNINSIEALFYSITDPSQQLFLSKIGVLELCGWVEESIDSLILESMQRSVHSTAIQKHVSEKVKKNYGFDYEKNFTNLLIEVLGAKNLEHLEQQADQNKLVLLKTTLSQLKNPRDQNAHTYIKSSTIIDAPSVIKSKISPISDGLVEIETKLIAFGY